MSVVLGQGAELAERLRHVSARSSDPVESQASALFQTPPRGSTVSLTAQCSSAATVSPKIQRVTWMGDVVEVGFLVTPAAACSEPRVLLDLNVFVEGICIGHLPLAMPLERLPAMQGLHAPTPGHLEPVTLRCPRRVFMSYTSHDREPVLQVARALRRFGVAAFMDRLSLEGGEDWERRIEHEIDRCDVFMLFWSSHAARSEWVVREARRALALQQGSAQRRPHIVTQLLGPPPPAQAPPGLERLQFNDPYYALWEQAMSGAATPQQVV